MIRYSSIETHYQEDKTYYGGSFEKALNYAMEQLKSIGLNEHQEALFAITMDKDHYIKGCRMIALGTYDYVPISGEEICRQTLRDEACRVLILHNHPHSFSLRPSQEDIACTDHLIQCCNMMNIELIDHIIVGDHKDMNRQLFSLRQNKVLDFEFYTKNYNPQTDISQLKWGKR